MAPQKGVTPPQFAEHVMHKHRVLPGGHLGPAASARHQSAEGRRTERAEALAVPQIGGARGARKGKY